MQVLVHAESEGSVSDWQGFGRELSRTGVAGDCKSERTVVVDMDLKTIFDVVHHDRLMCRLSETIGDKTLLRLIRKYFQSGIMVDGVVSQRTEGTPQGNPLSPLLSNIVLDEPDKELERRGTQICSICRRLQHLRTQPSSRRESHGIGKQLYREQTEPTCQQRQESGLRGKSNQILRLHHPKG
jgi:retron-type reverse transcriptase